MVMKVRTMGTRAGEKSRRVVFHAQASFSPPSINGTMMRVTGAMSRLTPAALGYAALAQVTGWLARSVRRGILDEVTGDGGIDGVGTGGLGVGLLGSGGR